MDVFAFERLEHDHVVYAVEEFRRESLAQRVLNHRQCILLLRLLLCFGAKAHACSKICELARTDIGGHDEDGVFEVNFTTQTVGHVAVV